MEFLLKVSDIIMVNLVKSAQVVEDLLKERAQIEEQIIEIDNKYSAQVKTKEDEMNSAIADLNERKEEALSALPDEEARYKAEISSKRRPLNSKIGAAKFWIGYYQGNYGTKKHAENILKLRDKYFAATDAVGEVRKKYGVARTIEIEVEDGDNIKQTIYRGTIGYLYKILEQLEKKNTYLLRRARALMIKSRYGIENLLDSDAEFSLSAILEEFEGEHISSLSMRYINVYAAMISMAGNMIIAHTSDLNELQLQYFSNENIIRKTKDAISGLEEQRDGELSDLINNVYALEHSLGDKIRARRKKIAVHKEIIAEAKKKLAVLNETVFDIKEQEADIGAQYISDKSELKHKYGCIREELMKAGAEEMQPLRDQISELDKKIAEARKALLAEERNIGDGSGGGGGSTKYNER